MGTQPIEPRRRIRPLDDLTVRRIAAGEVIERPASVVKELLENSLDAGARQVDVRIEEGGLASIEVSDDGAGIPPEDFPELFQRHRTSKLASGEDLSAVRTLGFRGEALASIAAVARVRVTSRAAGEGEARQLTVEGGNRSPVRSEARGTGTTVRVEALFGQTPARRKFLRSAAPEALRIHQVLDRAYLAHPTLDLRFLSDGELRFRYAAHSTLPEAAAELLPSAFVESAFPFRGSVGPGAWVEGLASGPAYSRGNADGIFLSVNGRPFSSRPLQEALRWAYRERLPRGRYPVVILSLTLDPERLDVNVHPTKREVRFQHEAELREALGALLHGALSDQPRPHDLPPPRSPSPGLPPAGPAQIAMAPAPPLAPSRSFVPPLAGFDATPPPSEPPHGEVLPGRNGLPSVRLLGQIGRLYLVAEDVDGSGALVLFDAHAASERLLYERLKAGRPATQQRLLFPRDLPVPPALLAVWEAHADGLAAQGFDAERFGRDRLRLRAVPAPFGRAVAAESLPALLEELSAEGSAAGADRLGEAWLKTAACHLAIRAGDELDLPEMRRLLDELYALPENFTCPHGRPISVRISRERLDRWFHRP
jgi:DNA mismatch repair protein MutL